MLGVMWSYRLSSIHSWVVDKDLSVAWSSGLSHFIHNFNRNDVIYPR